MVNNIYGEVAAMNIQKDFQKAGEDRLEHINDKIENYSELSKSERMFLYGIVNTLRPLKVLEVGVSAGASSAIILDAIAEIKGAHLFSVDLAEKYYRDGINWANLPEHQMRKVGFIVEQDFPALKDKWSLYTGGTAASFLEEEIGNEIDLVFLDAAHGLPGEVLDFILTLPYVKEDAVYIVHDINLQLLLLPMLTAPRVLMNTVKANKFYPRTTEHILPNIGAFQLTKDTRRHIEDLFNALLLDWIIPLSEEDASITRDLLMKHYAEALVNIYNVALEYNLQNTFHPLPLSGLANRISDAYSLTNQSFRNKHPLIYKLFLPPMLLLEKVVRRFFM